MRCAWFLLGRSRDAAPPILTRAVPIVTQVSAGSERRLDWLGANGCGKERNGIVDHVPLVRGAGRGARDE
jgi:hypothetical protein